MKREGKAGAGRRNLRSNYSGGWLFEGLLETEDRAVLSLLTQLLARLSEATNRKETEVGLRVIACNAGCGEVGPVGSGRHVNPRSRRRPHACGGWWVPMGLPWLLVSEINPERGSLPRAQRTGRLWRCLLEGANVDSTGRNAPRSYLTAICRTGLLSQRLCWGAPTHPNQNTAQMRPRHGRSYPHEDDGS